MARLNSILSFRSEALEFAEGVVDDAVREFSDLRAVAVFVGR